MLLSIDNARKTLPNSWLTMTACNVMATGLFVVPLFTDLSASVILTLMAIAAFIGMFMGIQLKFRSEGGTSSAFSRLFYFLITVEFLAAGGGAAAAVGIAGRPDLGWFAFFTNCFVSVLLLLGGMYRDAQTLGWLRSEIPDRWKSELGKYIDYSTHRISPSLTCQSTSHQGQRTLSLFWITAIGIANIPLLFELYGGGRDNSIFIAVPMIMIGLAYLNLKNFGPGFVRLLLLRKLEKEIDRRFVNADLEQIQELRRTFFLSRWLMKDYCSSQSGITNQRVPARQKRRR